MYISQVLKEFGHIYLFINKINGKRYIGQSIRVRDRISEHIQNVINKKNCVLYNAINRYGLENFEFTGVNATVDEYNFDKAKNVTGVLERIPFKEFREVEPNDPKGGCEVAIRMMRNNWKRK